MLCEHGVKIAPRTYYAHLTRPPSRKSLWDTTITEVLAGYYETGKDGRRRPESLYGAAKMWAHLRREGFPVARCTIERLMRINGWAGCRRRRLHRTTMADPAADRAPDMVDRQFRVRAPNRLVVADFTYVPLAGGGFVYTAFVIDAFAGVITGWECSTSKETQLVTRALNNAVTYRRVQGNPLGDSLIHHSDAGSQYTSVRFGEQLMLAGIRPSIGSVADAYDNALAETTIGLYKHEAIRADSPFRTGPLARLTDVEHVTAVWVHWYNTSRLLHRLGLIPPTEAEHEYYTQHQNDQTVVHT